MSYPDQITLSEYITARWKQLGVKHIFGCPGDFNLEFLDYIENDPELEWVGDANELGGAYAADGYARVKHGLGVLVTTFGVGELSALNGVAGSMAERLPILHLVGLPSTRLQGSHALLHHTLGNGSFDTFSAMSSHLVAAVGVLKQGSRWTEEVDRVMGVALTECKPVYLGLPTDLFHVKVSSDGLKTPLPYPHSAPPLPSSEENTLESNPVLSHVIDEITARFKQAKKPIAIIDVCADRFGCGPGLRKLVEKSGIRFFETPMGKSVLDEQHPQYGGAYVGKNSLPAVRQEVESADWVLMCGKLESDFNSGSFTFDLNVEKTIELHSFETKIGFASYPTTDIRSVVPLLTTALGKAVTEMGGPRKATDQSLQDAGEAQRAEAEKVPKEDMEGEIRHTWLWPRVGKFFKEHDLILAETGTSAFGIVNVPFPSNASCVVQTLWGSIGWATGAALGVALAATERKNPGRTILFTGEGSLQMTIQEVATMVKKGVCPYLFVINNGGYEIERQIHGVKAQYNNIQMIDHQMMLPFFVGKSNTPHASYAVHTPAELDALLKDAEFNVPDRIRLIEVFMPRGDAPASLLNQAKLTAEANAQA
ncbi:hypothetical protein NliqN6_3446 [Naganishia liquefaciens]|uniref:Pyruvate decarboxylase n=1 Tax=Naganishia liquefaciens TaxID=104408 RepID=A0A8H3TU11_9TREE|nr:hypothetical protein NliqN6_3446 [Naganishia liquefaciens]